MDIDKQINKAIKEIRLQKNMTQAEMAVVLEISQSRLSEIEQGRGSLSASQMIQVMKKFNLNLLDLVPHLNLSPEQEITNALDRLLGKSTKEGSKGVFSTWLYDMNTLFREIIAGYPAPHHILSMAKVIVRYIREINFDTIAMRLYDLGIDGRLWWLVEGLSWAIRARLKWDLPQIIKNHYELTENLLTRKQKQANYFFSVRKAYPLDVMDRHIISLADFERVKDQRDELAVRWRLITLITQENINEAIKQSEATLFLP